MNVRGRCFIKVTNSDLELGDLSSMDLSKSVESIVLGEDGVIIDSDNIGTLEMVDNGLVRAGDGNHAALVGARDLPNLYTLE